MPRPSQIVELPTKFSAQLSVLDARLDVFVCGFD